MSTEPTERSRSPGTGLRAKQAEAAKPGLRPYKLHDRGGLFLLVKPNGSKLWRWKFRLGGVERQASLGAFPTVGLADARSACETARGLVRAGKDPVAAKRGGAELPKPVVTFKELAERYLEQREEDWRNAKHRQQWHNTLATYVFPHIGHMAVGAIETADIEKLLAPIWRSKPETASRVRGRIETILSYAKTLRLRSGENPAAWRDNLKHTTLGNRKRVASHFAALDWRQMGGFMRRLRQQEGIGAKALEFTILTAARSGEVRSMAWAEVDIDNRLWVVPAERMKARIEHRVPLSDAALAVLAAMRRRKVGDDSLVFPGQATGEGGNARALSDMTLSAVLRRMGLGDYTVHGFRSTFRDWAAENTAYSRDVCEAALAHTIGNKVEAAYRRGDLLDKRRALMSDWANYCASGPTSQGAGEGKESQDQRIGSDA